MLTSGSLSWLGFGSPGHPSRHAGGISRRIAQASMGGGGWGSQVGELQGCSWNSPASSPVEDWGVSSGNEARFQKGEDGGGRIGVLSGEIGKPLRKLRQSGDLGQQWQSGGVFGGLRIVLPARRRIRVSVLLWTEIRDRFFCNY